MATVRKDIADLLVEAQVITPEQLQQIREAQKAAPGEIGQIVIDLGFANEKQVVQARARQLNIAFVDLTTQKIDPNAIKAVPENIARRHKVMPIFKNGSKLSVAMADVNNIMALDDLRSVTRLQVTPVLSTENAILEAIDRNYSGNGGDAASEGSEAPGAGGLAGLLATSSSVGGGTGMASVQDAIDAYKSRGEADEEDADALAKVAEEAPIIKVANVVIQQAVGMGASDIHVEPDRRHVRVRYRVDGVLHEEMTVPKYIQAPLISRFKIMADMNIAERRVPQDGRIGVRKDGKDYDLRVSCLPTVYGEKIVCRILDKSSVMIGMSKLGFNPATLARLEELIVQPNGMVLSTGPTGSGKTTTQYSVLHKINSVDKNIITVEDPVEYQLNGISQVQVNVKAGLTFGTALRSFLRQDPDIIMVGEMRDLETAEIAVEASLTGHLVLSTLHTNNAPSAVIRMVDMGVEPYLISATVIGVCAQRLARKVCSNCKEEYQTPATDLRVLGYQPKDKDEMVTLARGRGCEVCRHTGYKGRTGIHELMTMNDEIAELIVRRAPLADIREAAKANGMTELREDGLEKVLTGVTTSEEVRKVVFTAGQH
ncbi:MAG: Flp pilus assembly complex ATPase component TadA [Armatimonadetes bacterium]|nr:Flp pilus assembly complex ATPase component TadA [Armatimonadota bacterium]